MVLAPIDPICLIYAAHSWIHPSSVCSSLVTERAETRTTAKAHRLQSLYVHLRSGMQTWENELTIHIERSRPFLGQLHEGGHLRQ